MSDLEIPTSMPHTPSSLVPRNSDFLSGVELPADASIEERIEVARFRLDNERLDLEKERALADKRFWVKNFGTAITAIISMAAILVSLSQVWVASIQKEKELAIAQAQKDKEIDVAKNQKEKEIQTVIAQQDRAWKLDMAKFVTDHGNELLGKDKARRELITRVMITTFPPEYSADLIDRLEAVTNSAEVKQELQVIRTNVLPRIKENRGTEAPRFNMPSTEWPFTVPPKATPSPTVSTPPRTTACRCLEGGAITCPFPNIAVCKFENGQCNGQCFSFPRGLPY